MRITLYILTLLGLLGGPLAAVQETEPPLEARVWLDRGTDPVLDRGDRVRVYYRTSEDAYVTIFHINTDGFLRLIHPRGPGETGIVRGARDYRVLFPGSPYWYVDEYEGKGFFFAVASPIPFDFDAFRYIPRDQAWDLSNVGKTVYEDPYVAMDEIVASILPEWESVPYGLDFISYDVGATHEYPRFMCYECHGFRSYTSWNPYTYSCTDFRVVVWNDPYFQPAYRYGPTRVVYSSSFRGRARFTFKERRVDEPWTPLTRTRQPPMRRPVQYAEPSAAAPSRPVLQPPRGRVTEPRRPSATSGGDDRRAVPSARRPATPPSGGAAADTRRPTLGTSRRAAPDRPTGAAERPVLQRRPASGATRPSARPSGNSSRPSAQPSGGATRPSARPTKGATRPSARPSGGSARPKGGSARPGGSSRPTARPKGGSARPKGGSVRPGGSSRPIARPKGGSVRPKGGSARPGGSSRPTARPKGGSARPSARPKRPGGG